MIMSCSSPDQRRKLVEQSFDGEIIFQDKPNTEGVWDLFIVKNGNIIKVVKVSNSGSITKTIKISMDK